MSIEREEKKNVRKKMYLVVTFNVKTRERIMISSFFPLTSLWRIFNVHNLTLRNALCTVRGQYRLLLSACTISVQSVN